MLGSPPSMQGGPGNPFDLSAGLALTEIKINLGRLDAVDDLWTAYLDGATAENVEHQKEQLDELAGRLIEALDSARGSVARLHEMLRAAGEEEIELALQEIARGYPKLDVHYRQDLADLLDKYTVHEFVLEACSYLEDQLPQEIESVEKKRQRLREGEFQPGDIGPGAKCALKCAILAAKLLDIPTTGGAATMVLEGAMALGSFAAKWRGSCQEIGGRVWRRLRRA